MPVSAEQPAAQGAKPVTEAAKAWQEVRADESIQFEPTKYDLPIKPLNGHPGEVTPLDPTKIQPAPPKPPPEPSTLGEAVRSVFEPIGKALGIAWPVMQWILIGIGVAIAAFLIWKLISPWLERRAIAAAIAAEEAAAWAPDRDQAQALLDDADALAAAGRFDEATHLLLERSVEHIAKARPDWVLPASTTREISAIASLPERARGAFGLIAQRVERSLFALRSLDRDDWLAARAAYADFALERIDSGAER